MIIDRHQPESSERIPSSSRLNDLKWNSHLHFSEMTSDSFQRNRFGGRSYQMIAWSWVAAVIDTLIAMSLSLLFFAAFALINRLEASVLVHEYSVIFIAGLFFVYLTVSRVFLGFTVGEWACDLRMGSLMDRLHPLYSLKVIARTSLILATGIFTLPILSMIFGRDICGGLVGLSLVSKK